MKRHAALNRIYRLIWSEIYAAWIPVAETVKGRRKGTGGRRLLAIWLALFPKLLFAAPGGGTISAGSGSISQAGNTTTIMQQTPKLVVDWNSFSIGTDETVRFNQPSASSIALNRVIGQDPSRILGSLQANGQIFLLNPNGVLFGQGAQVNVGGVLASTLQLSNSDFMAGHYHLTGDNNSTASVVNQGTLQAIEGGYIALMAPQVVNEGTISAPKGNVALASGSAVTVTFPEHPRLSFQVEQGTVDGLVANKGIIQADGGQVILTAKGRDSVLSGVVNNEGVIQARSSVNQNGVIKLLAEGGTVTVGGTLDASASNGGDGGSVSIGGAGGQVLITGQVQARSNTGSGGSIEVTGSDIRLQGARLDTSGAQAGGAVRIGGDFHGQGNLVTAQTTAIDATSTIKADATGKGNGGSVVVWSNSLTDYEGSISARGGLQQGNGGQVEVSSHNLLNFTGTVDLSAPLGATGSLLLDPYNVIIQTASGAPADTCTTGVCTPSGTNSILTVSALQTALASSNVTVTTGASGADAGNITVSNPVSWAGANTLSLTAANNIALNAAITATNGGLTLTAGASVTPSAAGAINVGSFNLMQGNWSQTSTAAGFLANSFSIGVAATFRRVNGGAGTTVSPYSITDVYGLQGIGSSATYLGYSYTLSSNIDATSTSGWNSGGGFVPIGANGGTAYSGTFNGANYAIANLTINQPSNATGVGLFGYTNGATIQNLSLLQANVTGGSGGNSGYGVGALIGAATNATMISNIVTTGSVTGSAAAGANANVGGIVGDLSGSTLSNSASAVNVVSALANTGGAVGSNESGSTIQSVSAVSSVNSTAATTGGLVGSSAGTVTNSYSTGAVSGTSAIGGLIGDTSGSATNSYTSGVVNGSTQVGGFAGSNSGTIIGSYWNTTTSGQGAGSGTGATSGMIGASTAVLQTQSTFTGWDFANNWALVSGYSPTLRGGTTILGGQGGNLTVSTAVDSSVNVNTTSLQNLLAAGNVLVSTSSGNLTISNPVTWPNVNNLGLAASGQLSVNAGANIVSSGINLNQLIGSLNLFSGNGTLSVNSASLSTTYGGILSLWAPNSGSATAVSLSDATLSAAFNTGTTNGGSGSVMGNSTSGVGISFSGTNIVTDYASPFAIVGRSATGVGVSFSAGATLTTTGIVSITGKSISSNSTSASFFLGGNNNFISSFDNMTLTGGDATMQGTGIYAAGSETFTNNGTAVILLNGTSAAANGVQIAGAAAISATTNSGLINITGSGAVADIDLSATGNITLGSGALTGAGHAINIAATGTGTIALSSSITNATGSLNLSAATATTSITDSAAVNVGTFALNQGAWSQNTANLPSFSATNFTVGSSASFLRATGGAGSSGSPYLINDVYGLQGIGTSATYLANSYTLTNDINATGTSGWNSGAGFVPIGVGNGASPTSPTSPYSGVFDGNNYSIINLLINSASTTASTGLFGTVSGNSAVVKNLDVLKATVTGAANGNGILAGLVTNGATVTNVATTGAITGSTNPNTGGIVGYLVNATLSNSSSAATVTATSNDVGGAIGGLGGTGTTTVSNVSALGAISASTATNVGGLIGLAGETSGTYSISNSYARGAVTGSSAVGGFFGGNAASETLTLTNAYSTGAVTGTTNVAGFIGLRSSGTVTASYWDTTTSGKASGVGSGVTTGITGRTTANMLIQANYSGWDFTNTWLPPATALYPLLRVGNTIFSGATETVSTGANSATVVNTTTLQSLLATGNVLISSPTSTVTVSNPVTWSSGSKLTLASTGALAVNANANLTATGTGDLDIVSTANKITVTTATLSTNGGELSVTAPNATTNAAVTLTGVTLGVGSGIGLLSGISTTNYGLNIATSSSYSASGAGSLTLKGTSTSNLGLSSNSNASLSTAGTVNLIGVSSTSAGVSLCTASCTVPLTDTAGDLTLSGTSTSGIGLAMYGGTITNNSSGNFNLIGASTSSNGINMSNANSLTNSSTGSLSLQGTSGSGNGLGLGGTITTSGTVAMNGLGTAGGRGADASPTINVSSGAFTLTTESTESAGSRFTNLTVNSSGIFTVNGISDENSLGFYLRSTTTLNSLGSGVINLNGTSSTWFGISIQAGLLSTSGTVNLNALSNSLSRPAAGFQLLSGLAITDNSGNLTFDGGSTSSTAYGILAAGGLSLTNNGTGTLLFHGVSNALSGVQLFATGGLTTSNTSTGAVIISGSGVGSDIDMSISGTVALGAGTTLTGSGQGISLASSAGPISLSGTSINTANGALSISASAAGTSDAITLSGSTIDIGTGTATIAGVSTSGQGLVLTGANTFTANGAGSFTWTGASSTGNGVAFSAASSLTANGTVALSGTSASGVGVQFNGANSLVNNGPSTLTVSGTSAGGADGLQLASSATLSTTGSTTFTGVSSSGIGIDFLGSNSVTDNNGALILNGDTMALTGTLNGNSSGSLTLLPVTSSTSIGLGDGQSGTLNLTASALATIQPGFASVTVGSLSGTGAINVGNWTANAPLTIESAAGSGSVMLNGALATGTGSSSGSISLNGASAVTFGTGASITTSGQAVSVSGPTVLAGSIATSGGTVTFNNATTLAGNASVNAGAGATTFVSAVDGGNDLSVTADLINLGGTLGGANPLAAVSLTSVQALTLPSISATSLVAQTTGVTSDLTLASGTTLTASASGQAVQLAAGRNFVNQSGSGAIVLSGTGTPSWRIYSATPSADTFGGLNSFNPAVWGISYGATVSNSGSRYMFSYQPTAIFTSVSDSKTYGVDASATIGADYAVSGLQSGVAGVFMSDTNASVFSGAPSVTSAGAATGATVAGGPYAMAMGSGTLMALNGYAFAFQSPGLLSVIPRSLNVIADSQTQVYGNAVPALSYTVSGSGLVNGDTLSGALSTTATNTSNVGAYPIAQGTLAASPNYNLSYTGANDTITARLVTITADNQTQVYGNAVPTLSYTVGGSGLVNGDTLSGALSTTATNTSNVGAYPIAQGTLTASLNYNLNYIGASDMITAKALTLSGVSAANKVYDGATADTLSGGTLGGVISGDTVSLSLGSATFADKNVGTGKTVSVSGTGLTGTDANNYSITDPSGLSANITARALTVSATGINKTYDATTVASVTLGDNRVSGDTLSLADSAATFADKNVGTAKTVSVSGITVTGVDAGSYTFNTTVSTSANIAAKALILSGVSAANKVYDGTTSDTVSGGTLGGVISGDTVSLSLGSATFADKNVGTGKTVSVSGTGLTGTDANNYSITDPSGLSANVTARALTVSATGINKTYDATTVASATLGDNRVSGDTLSLADSVATFADKNVGTAKMVSVSGITVTGVDAGNYTFNTTASTSANITAKALTLSGVSAANKVYDGNTADTISGGTLGGVIDGDNVILKLGTGSFADANVGIGKAVTVSGSGLSGVDANNYMVSDPIGLTANIIPLALPVSLLNQHNNYVSNGINPVDTGASGQLTPQNMNLAPNIYIESMGIELQKNDDFINNKSVSIHK